MGAGGAFFTEGLERRSAAPSVGCPAREDYEFVDTGACRNLDFLRPFAPEVWNNGNGAEAQDERAARANLLQ
jgi:hypothetical protein